MNVGVIVFPGSNCDHDVYHVFAHVIGHPTRFLWHQETELGDTDLVVLPGGFSYGDYLRAGSMAARSPIFGAIRRHAERGGLLLGICNGFQMLLESELLPGAMRRNEELRFLSTDVHLRTESVESSFTGHLATGDVLRMPIAHAEGNFVHFDEELDAIDRNGQVVFRYVDAAGATTPDANLNGSERSIAGICNAGGNVLGLMPHPERCAEELLGNTDGLRFLEGISVGAARAVALGAST